MLIFIPDNVVITGPKIHPRIYKRVEEDTESGIEVFFFLMVITRTRGSIEREFYKGAPSFIRIVLRISLF
jgi:hypothetical protein